MTRYDCDDEKSQLLYWDIHIEGSGKDDSVPKAGDPQCTVANNRQIDNINTYMQASTNPVSVTTTYYMMNNI